MTYSFENLSPADFEDLVRDLLGKSLGIRFECFGPGADNGIDGRHCSSKHGRTIIQAKHFAGSSFSGLLRAMRTELATVNKLAPEQYILATSQKLTPARKDKLIEALGSHIRQPGDIYGFEELNALLRNEPSVVRSHIKLWLSGSAVLDRILRAASHAFTDVTREEINSKVKVYVQNPSFDAGRKILEKSNVLIISGPPGVGKSTLAEILAFAYSAKEWELVSIRSLDDGFAALRDQQRQVFFFDDFLGKIALDHRALASKDSELARFIGRVRRSKNVRFILTTRAYIFEEAKRSSEYLSDKLIDVSKYVLDVGVYTREVRANPVQSHPRKWDFPALY